MVGIYDGCESSCHFSNLSKYISSQFMLLIVNFQESPVGFVVYLNLSFTGWLLVWLCLAIIYKLKGGEGVKILEI